MTSDTPLSSASDIDNTLVWEQLTEVIEAFTAAWERAPQPDVADFLPPQLPALRRMALLELLKVDMEFRAQQGALLSIEQYLEQWPLLLEDGKPPLDLVFEDYQVRQQADLPVSLTQYCTRFPHCASALNRMIGTHSGGSTMGGRIARPIRTFEPGESVDDFQIVSQLGKGAFATVYLARQVSMQRLVALKISADKGVEHQVLAQLDHPYIVRVYDVRKMPELGARLLYMQYVSGGTLLDAIKTLRQSDTGKRSDQLSGQSLLGAIDRSLVSRGESPPTDSQNRDRLAGLDWPRAVALIGSQLAAGLAFAHRQNVLHRDLKPANILLAANGTPQLVDFNISYSNKIDGVTPAAYFGGSLAYMSPEQLEAFSPDHQRTAESLDERADLFSLGCILFELLTGDKAFPAVPTQGNVRQMLAETLRQRQRGLSEEARKKLVATPPLLKDAIEHCLHPDSLRRYPTAVPLSRQLEWAVDPAVEQVLLPSRGGPGKFIERFPTLVCAVDCGIDQRIGCLVHLCLQR